MREVAVERGIANALNTCEAGVTKSLLNIPSRFVATDCQADIFVGPAQEQLRGALVRSRHAVSDNHDSVRLRH